MSGSTRANRFLLACGSQPVDRTPVWLMRQAGRYMPEYRALRERHSILEMIRSPELAAEVTLQPVNAFEIDAAIIFADILPLLSALGMRLEFVRGEGPVLHNPIRHPADIDRLRPTTPEEGLGFTLEAIRLARRALDGVVPLIGFSGAPFTLACYAIEGGGSKTFARARAFMKQEPAAWERLMNLLTESVADYLIAQAEAGAQALQLFDSWAGTLSVEDYVQHVQPWSREVLRRARAAKVPLIHFGTGPMEITLEMARAGGSVIGIGCGQELARTWDALGSELAVQGNFDPELLAAGPLDDIFAQARSILDSVRGRPGHIFNLGHGVLKQTPVEHVQALIDFVHEASG